MSEKINRKEFLQISLYALGALALPLPKSVQALSVGDLDSRHFPDISPANKTDKGVGAAAQSYIAKTYKEARKVSETLRGFGADPSNICGPLSVAIGLDWRLQPDGSIYQGNNRQLEGIAPADFWLASPEGEYANPKLFLSAFPQNKYSTFRIKESIKTLDFNNIPDLGKLKPGDFLYFTGGSFTHFIIVSRQGSHGELYATTNIPGSGDNKFIIDEVKLWDPTINDGFLRNLAIGIGPEKATTGRSGFYLWRRNRESEQMLTDPVAEKYRNLLINRLRGQTKGKWNVLISQLGKGELIEWRDRMVYHPASTIKVPIAVSMMQVLYEQLGLEIKQLGLKAVLQNRGVDGRTYDQLIESMLVNSEEAATASCENYVNQVSSLEKKFRDLGLNETTYSPRRSSQQDIYTCWNRLFAGQLLDTAGTKYILNKLSEFTPNDKIMIGAVKRIIPATTQWNKRGEVVGGGLYTMQDTGVVKIDNRYFYLGFAGTSLESNCATDVELVSFIEELCGIFVQFVKETSVLHHTKKR